MHRPNTRPAPFLTIAPAAVAALTTALILSPRPTAAALYETFSYGSASAHDNFNPDARTTQPANLPTFDDSNTAGDNGTWTPGSASGGAPAAASGSNNYSETLFASGSFLSGTPVIWHADGAATANASAGSGALHAYAQAQAHVQDTYDTVYYTNDQGDTASRSYYNPYSVTSGAGASAGWRDTFTVTSPSLADGTFVTLHVTVALDSAVASPNPGSAAWQANAGIGMWMPGTSYNPFINLTNTGTTPQLTKTANIGVQIGVPFGLEAHASAQASAYAHADPFGIVGLQSATADASNTAHFAITFDDPTLSLSSASGLTYALPEPTTAVAALSLLLPPTLRRRRHHA